MLEMESYDKDSSSIADGSADFRTAFGNEFRTKLDSDTSVVNDGYPEKFKVPGNSTKLVQDFPAEPSSDIVSVFDVACYVMSRVKECTTMKLQKLLYYCQAWYLVWNDKPLFSENIEAWANGPVIRELYNFHKGLFTITENMMKQEIRPMVSMLICLRKHIKIL